MNKSSAIKSTGSVRRNLIAAGFMFVCLFLLVDGRYQTAYAEGGAAQDAAESFFELVDAGSYQQAWWEGSELLHLTTDLDSWVEKARLQHELLGKFQKRTVKNLVLRSSQPGLPDGEYVILLYESRHERKEKGLEILVLHQDLYEGWRVVTWRLQ